MSLAENESNKQWKIAYQEVERLLDRAKELTKKAEALRELSDDYIDRASKLLDEMKRI